jgi:hypothetical protein
MSLSASAAAKRAKRRGYRTKQHKGKLSLWDRNGKLVLSMADSDEVDTFLRDANKREARAWPSSPHNPQS